MLKMNEKKKALKLTNSMDQNLNLITESLGDEDTGVVIRKFYILGGRLTAGLIYLKNMVDQNSISQLIIKPLMKETAQINDRSHKLLKLLQMQFITAAETYETDSVEQLVEHILSGYAVLFIQDANIALAISAKRIEKRKPEKPDNEIGIISGKVAFVEDIDLNCSMLRSRLPVKELKFEKFTIGRLSRTKVFLIWVDGIANPKIINEARHRIRGIDVDNVISMGLLAELIEDKPLSLWTKYNLSERPDIVAQNLAEGRFAIICDHVPQVLIAPIVFWQKHQTIDDYSEKAIIGSFIRIVRHIGFYIALLTSPIYLAFVAYNHTIIPPALAFNIAMGRQGVPFPSIVEVLLMTIFIEILREVAIRTSTTMGPAIGILGAVVIGQAAVAAGYISPSLIIVIAVSAIATFSIPNISLINVVRISNFILIILAGILGIFGMVTGCIIFLWQLVSLRSFGIPFLYPLSPSEGYGFNDIFIRSPFWSLRRRPSLIAPKNQVRMGNETVKPKTPKKR